MLHFCNYCPVYFLLIFLFIKRINNASYISRCWVLKATQSKAQSHCHNEFIKARTFKAGAEHFRLIDRFNLAALHPG